MIHISVSLSILVFFLWESLVICLTEVKYHMTWNISCCCYISIQHVSSCLVRAYDYHWQAERWQLMNTGILVPLTRQVTRQLHLTNGMKYELLSPFPIFVQCKTSLGKDLYCVEWDVNPYSTQLNMCNVILQCFYRSVLRSARYCYSKSSICLYVHNVEVPWSHRLEIFKNNLT